MPRGLAGMISKDFATSAAIALAQRRGHGVSDLPGAVPLGRVQAEPVREAVEPRHLPHRDAAVVTVVDRPGARERPPRAVGAGAQRV